MKYILYIAFFSLLLVVACIRKNPKPAPPKEQLPPYTETGANTFGCMIDGEVFVPGKPAFSMGVILQCTYQYISGDRYFNLAAHDFINNRSLAFNSKNKIIFKNIYQLGNWYSVSDFGCKYGTTNPTTEYLVLFPNRKGELNIKHFDSINQIISGTFWFDAVDTATGKVVHVTDGRFDVSYYK